MGDFYFLWELFEKSPHAPKNFHAKEWLIRVGCLVFCCQITGAGHETIRLSNHPITGKLLGVSDPFLEKGPTKKGLTKNISRSQNAIGFQQKDLQVVVGVLLESDRNKAFAFWEDMLQTVDRHVTAVGGFELLTVGFIDGMVACVAVELLGHGTVLTV
ncbi:MAG: hypothetical protein IJZ21_02230, partial [Clostridia bacterium]|nr:hypothetical protein [Clostridia bacterium]